MRITELFNKPIPWQWQGDAPGWKTATFNVDGQKYQITFEEGEEDPEGHWWIEFGIDKGPLRRREYGITGTGNELVVFSTIIEIMRDFIQKNNPEVLGFSAKEPSRRKLYQRMVKSLGQGWDVTTKLVAGTDGQELEFRLARPN